MCVCVWNMNKKPANIDKFTLLKHQLLESVEKKMLQEGMGHVAACRQNYGVGDMVCSVNKTKEIGIRDINRKFERNRIMKLNENLLKNENELSVNNKQDKIAEKQLVECPIVTQLMQNQTPEFLIDNFYIVDGTTSVDKSIFDVKKFLKTDYSIEQTDKPQILIYHTHGGSEQYVEGGDNSVIKVGSELADYLENKYGFSVIHDCTKYDVINGKLDRNKAYNNALNGVKKQLEKHPEIEVLIDLHRDGGNNKERRVTCIEGEQVAQFMIFNGLSRNKKGEIAYLKNENLQDNLAFGLQLKIEAMKKYPDLTIRNYLKGYRYNLHLKKRSLLIELGNQNNTMDEALNTTKYLAEILANVLKK